MPTYDSIIAEVMPIINQAAARFPAHLRDDLRQEARIALWRALDRYDPSKSLRAFAWHISYRAMQHYYRDFGPLIHIPAKTQERDPDALQRYACLQFGKHKPPTYHPQTFSWEDRILLRDFLASLKPKQRTFAILYYFQGYSGLEAARMAGFASEYASALRKILDEKLRALFQEES